MKSAAKRLVLTKSGKAPVLEHLGTRTEVGMGKALRRGWLVLLGMAALTAPFASTDAGAQIVTRLVVPATVNTSTTIFPGQTATFEVRLDAPTVPTIGTAYLLSQTAPPLNGNPKPVFVSETGWVPSKQTV